MRLQHSRSVVPFSGHCAARTCVYGRRAISGSLCMRSFIALCSLRANVNSMKGGMKFTSVEQIDARITGAHVGWLEGCDAVADAHKAALRHGDG